MGDLTWVVYVDSGSTIQPCSCSRGQRMHAGIPAPTLSLKFRPLLRTQLMSNRVCHRQYVPVDTIICFRASIPLVVAVLESAYMGRELPSPRSWAALFGAPRIWPLRRPALHASWMWIVNNLLSASAGCKRAGSRGLSYMPDCF